MSRRVGEGGEVPSGEGRAGPIQRGSEIARVHAAGVRGIQAQRAEAAPEGLGARVFRILSGAWERLTRLVRGCWPWARPAADGLVRPPPPPAPGNPPQEARFTPEIQIETVIDAAEFLLATPQQQARISQRYRDPEGRLLSKAALREMALKRLERRLKDSTPLPLALAQKIRDHYGMRTPSDPTERRLLNRAMQSYPKEEIAAAPPIQGRLSQEEAVEVLQRAIKEEMWNWNRPYVEEAYRVAVGQPPVETAGPLQERVEALQQWLKQAEKHARALGPEAAQRELEGPRAQLQVLLKARRHEVYKEAIGEPPPLEVSRPLQQRIEGLQQWLKQAEGLASRLGAEEAREELAALQPQREVLRGLLKERVREAEKSLHEEKAEAETSAHLQTRSEQLERLQGEEKRLLEQQAKLSPTKGSDLAKTKWDFLKVKGEVPEKHRKLANKIVDLRKEVKPEEKLTTQQKAELWTLLESVRRETREALDPVQKNIKALEAELHRLVTEMGPHEGREVAPTPSQAARGLAYARAYIELAAAEGQGDRLTVEMAIRQKFAEESLSFEALQSQIYPILRANGF